MITALKITVILFASALVLIAASYIAYINFTPGKYVKYGCCNYGFLTEDQIREERMKINFCPKVECKIEETTGYKLQMLFNVLDFNQ